MVAGSGSHVSSGPPTSTGLCLHCQPHRAHLRDLSPRQLLLDFSHFPTTLVVFEFYLYCRFISILNSISPL